MSKVLIVVDMQVDFIDGALANPEAQKIVDKVAMFARNFEGKVFYTLDTHDENYLNTYEGQNLPIEHCIYGSLGHCLDPKIMSNLNKYSHIITKHTFGYTEWQKMLPPDVDEITLVGVCTDICVVSNALILRALYPNIEIKIRNDLCAGTSVEAHQAALTTMASCQITIE